MPDLRTTTLIALAALPLALGLARSALADPASDDRDRAAAAHSRDRNTGRTRVAATGGPESAASGTAVQDPQLLCDKVCLQAVADLYLKAVVAHDPKLLSLDDHVRFTEDGQELQLGDGFWTTARGWAPPSSSIPIRPPSRSPLWAPCASSTTWC